MGIDFKKQSYQGSDKDWVKPETYEIIIDDKPSGYLCEHLDAPPTYWFIVDNKRYSGVINYKQCPWGIFDFMATEYNKIIKEGEKQLQA